MRHDELVWIYGSRTPLLRDEDSRVFTERCRRSGPHRFGTSPRTAEQCCRLSVRIALRLHDTRRVDLNRILRLSTGTAPSQQRCCARLSICGP